MQRFVGGYKHGRCCSRSEVVKKQKKKKKKVRKVCVCVCVGVSSEMETFRCNLNDMLAVSLLYTMQERMLSSWCRNFVVVDKVSTVQYKYGWDWLERNGDAMQSWT